MITTYYILEFRVIATDPNNHLIQIDIYPAELCTSDKVNAITLYCATRMKLAINYNCYHINYHSYLNIH